MLPKSFNRILIVRTDRIGDVVLTTPVIKLLKKAYPMAQLSFLATPSTKDLVEGNPYLDEVIVDDLQGVHKGVMGALRLAREIRRRNFDAAFIFHTKRRYNGGAYLVGIPIRIGYKNNKNGFLLTHPIKDTRGQGHKHEADYCLDVLKAVGINELELSLFVPTHKEAESWANQWLAQQGINSNQLIVIHPGASDPKKCWSAKNFAQLIDALHQRYFLKTVLIGNAQSTGICKEIAALTRHKPFDLSGHSSLPQTISLLRRSRLLISNDSGPVHIASALGIYVISLFTRNDPGVNIERWKPLSSKGFCLFKPEGVAVSDIIDLVEQIFHKDHQEFFHW